MCGVCQEVKSVSMQSSLFAAGLAGVAVGAKLSWRQLVARVRGDSRLSEVTTSTPVSEQPKDLR